MKRLELFGDNDSDETKEEEEEKLVMKKLFSIDHIPER